MRHIQRSDLMARELNLRAPRWVHRLDTDDRTIFDLAAEIISLASWTLHPPSG
ncbi:MAG TPA: hypothetical protein VHY21_22870 [Pseudonocardiaceae bacterium]|jgi:hypothetical protein|nr:hypothetical protein [Pseudonocardiaceae bacterium]